MNRQTPNESLNPYLFLRSLQEEGIEEIYVEGRGGSRPSPQTPQTSDAKEALIRLRGQTSQCTLCAELAETRKSVVFGSGNIKAKLMLIGEAPGEEEDLQGLPFVGKAGQLLTKIIESIGLSRRDVFIANVLKCRPPGNRSPRPEEVLNCKPYLIQQIEWIQPHMICCLGNFAAQTLLETTVSVSQLRGKFHAFGRAKVLCTYHPAYLLRNPSEKRKVWEDMKKIKRELESLS